jgi:phage/plasmid primase-like uncharacterized protein
MIRKDIYEKIIGSGYKISYQELQTINPEQWKRFGPKQNHAIYFHPDGGGVCEDKSQKLQRITWGGKQVKNILNSQSFRKDGKSIYLEKKNIPSENNILYHQKIGGEENEIDFIYIPIQNQDGEIISFQDIYNDGTKSYLSNAPKKGGFHIIGDKNDSDCLIFCEGYATSYSIYNSINNIFNIVVCFDITNMKNVVESFRTRYPSKDFLIAGDDDRHQINNIGRIQAESIAASYNCKVSFPVFQDYINNPTDFNDLFIREGKDVVKKQIMDALNSSPLESNNVIEILEELFNEDKKHWRKIKILNLAKENIIINIEGEKLAESKEVKKILAKYGLHFSNSALFKENIFPLIATSHQGIPIKNVYNDKCGWRDNNKFCFPGLDHDYEPSNYPPFTRKGNIKEFNEKILEIANGNYLIIFVLAFCFLPLFTKKLKFNNFGIHLKGSSSIGKTTLLKLASSLWGTHIKSWNSTVNAMELMGYRYQDTLLCLDEISEVNPKILSEMIYILGNGSGKSRLNKDATEKERKIFSLNFLSTGEMGLEDIFGREIKGGQTVRFIEIDCEREYGVFDKKLNFVKCIEDINSIIDSYQNIPIFNLINSFNDNLISMFNDNKAVFKNLRIEKFPFKAYGQLERIGEAFDNIAAAGMLAVQSNCLPNLNIEEAILKIFESFINERGIEKNEISVTKKRLMDLIISYPHRFLPTYPTIEKVNKLAGYRENLSEESTYYITIPCFKDEICKNLNYKYIRTYLLDEKIIEESIKKINSNSIRVFKLNKNLLEDYTY